jgi:MYXO-CTERM domain-containing protein
MTPRAPVVVALVVVLAAVGAVPVVGHGNHVSANPQVVDDHLVVESSFLANQAGGYAVVHVDEGDRIGKPVGHVRVRNGREEAYAVPVDESFLSKVEGTASMWVVLHGTDGDGEFEPGDDEPIRGIGTGPAGDRVRIAVGTEGNVNVASGGGLGATAIDEPAVTVRRLETNASGVVAIEHGGSVVGTASVDAGVNENVTVSLDESFYDDLAMNESVQLRATVYREDDAGERTAVAVGDERVSTRFEVTRVADADRSTSIVVPATDAPTTDGGGETTAPSSTEPGSGPTPGFELAAAALAALLAVAAVRRRVD